MRVSVCAVASCNFSSTMDAATVQREHTLANVMLAGVPAIFDCARTNASWSGPISTPGCTNFVGAASLPSGSKLITTSDESTIEVIFCLFTSKRLDVLEMPRIDKGKEVCALRR